MKSKIVLLLVLFLLTSCATNSRLPIISTYCGYQEYSALESVGLPGAVDMIIVTRRLDNGIVRYTSERKKIYNIYCQGRLDTLKVNQIYETRR